MSSFLKFVETITYKYDRQDDYIFTERIKVLALDHRAKLLRDSYAKDGIIPSTAKQQISCLPLIRVDISECCSEETGCYIARSKCKLPNKIRFKEGYGYSFVGGVQSIGFGYIEPEQIPLLKHRKFTSMFTYYMIYNNYVYIIGDIEAIMLDKIRIRDAFADPLYLLENFSCSGDCFEENDFMIEEDLAPVIRQLIDQDLNRKEEVMEEQVKTDV
jgi:hypothetical protein